QSCARSHTTPNSPPPHHPINPTECRSAIPASVSADGREAEWIDLERHGFGALMDAAQRGRQRSSPFRDGGEVAAHHVLMRFDACVHRRLVDCEQAAAL